MDCMTKLQSLNIRNIELGEPEPGDLADNQAVTDSFLGTGRGQKHSRAISISILLSLRYFKILTYKSINNHHN